MADESTGASTGGTETGGSAGTAATSNTTPNQTSQSQTSNQQGTGQTPWSAEKLKINGQEREYSRDEILIAAQKYYGGDDKFKQASQMRKEAEEILGSLADTKAARKLLSSKMGAEKLRAMAIEMLEEELQQQMMSPEEKRAHDAEKKAKELEEKLKEKEEAENQARMQKEMEAIVPALDKEIADAFESSFLDKNPMLLKEAMKRRLSGIEENIRIPFSVIVKQLEREILGYAKFVKNDPQKLIEAFGEETVSNLRKFETDKLKKAPNINNISSNNSDKVRQAQVTEKVKEKGYLTTEEFREHMERIKEESRRGK